MFLATRALASMATRLHGVPTRVASGILAILVLGGGPLMSEKGPVEELDTIEGGNFRIIQAALPAFEGERLDLAHHQISVVRSGEVVTVVFTDRATKKPTGLRGNPGPRPGYQVEVDPHDLHIRNSHFIR
jgi:hypothetical protein